MRQKKSKAQGTVRRANFEDNLRKFEAHLRNHVIEELGALHKEMIGLWARALSGYDAKEVQPLHVQVKELERLVMLMQRPLWLRTWVWLRIRLHRIRYARAYVIPIEELAPDGGE